MTTDDTTSAEGAGSAPPLRVVLHSRTSRVVTGVLGSMAGATLLGVLCALVLSSGPVHVWHLLRLVAALYLLPAVAGLAIRRGLAASVRIAGGVLRIEQRHRLVEIPIASIAALEPWLLPLPGSGMRVRLRSGAIWSGRIELDDPAQLIAALVAGGGAPRLRAAVGHPSLIYAHARSARPRSWRRILLAFPGFALVPTVPLFRVHQLIAYGGVLGEYYQYGFMAYLAGFAIYWATLTVYLMAYAAGLRVPVELLTIASVAMAPRYAARVRRMLERSAAVLYYAGVPVAVALRFVPW